MSDILLFLAILLGQCLLVYFLYRVFRAIILYRVIVDSCKEAKNNDS